MLTPVLPENYASTDYGLIAPNGQLYSCNYCGHGTLVQKLENVGVLEDNERDHRGAVHVARGTFDYIESFNEGRKFYQDCGYENVTQRQFDTMIDYAAARELTFDFSRLVIT